MRSVSGISKDQWRKDAPALLIVFWAVAFIPISAFLLRPRSLAAATAGELIALVREQTAEESLTILSQHEATWNPESLDDRWKEIEQELYNSDQDLDVEEVSGVLRVAKTALSSAGWPLFAKRASLNGNAVWVIACGVGGHAPAYICPPSLSELHHDRLESAKSGMTVTVVAAQAPYRTLTR